MALPIPTNTEIFSNDQQITYRAYYWNTSTTAVRLGEAHAPSERYLAFGSGVEFAMFDLYDAEFSPTTRDAIETALRSRTSTRSVLGYDETGNYRTGVVPLVYMYWGAGAPPGGGRAKQVVLKFSGYVREDFTGTLVFAGQGTVHAFVTRAGTSQVQKLVGGTIKEPDPTLDLSVITPITITEEWGYRYASTTFNKGDYIEIYYWHNGEPWGGIACKVVPGVIQTDDTFLKALREAPVLATSIIAKEPDYLPPVVIPYLDKAELRVQEGTISELRLSVPMVSGVEERGYRLDTFNDEHSLVSVNPLSTIRIRKGRLIHFEGGFVTPTGEEEVYPRFTGIIEDITLEAGGERAVIHCRNVESKLSYVFDENNPDRLAYHANGFILRERSSEPVFGIPAYDNWPLEVAVADLCYRAGIDPYNLGLSPFPGFSNVGRFEYHLATTGNLVFGYKLFAARTLANPDKMIVLERQPNYGNVPPLKRDYLPDDDGYLFKPEVTQRLYDRAKTLTDHYGYDFFANAEGQIVLTGRNNPVYFQYMTRKGLYLSGSTEGANQKVEVSAVGGIVFAHKHSQGLWQRQIEGNFSRLDLYVGIGRNADGLNGGKIRVTVEARNALGQWSQVLDTEISTYWNGDEAYYYDDYVRADGTNAAVFRIMSLPFDYYRVTLSPAGPAEGETDCWYRLNGVAVYERDPDQSYYTQDYQTRVFSTLGNAIRVDTTSNYQDMRNQVIVVGARRATVTDSAKLDGENVNPNNPEYEFHVATAVDPLSIYDPTNPRFVGGKRMVVVFDEKVNDSDFARWLARTILYRYNNPAASARFTHTVIPALELRDALFVVEERHRSVEHLLWVTGFVETWSPTEALTQIEASAQPEIPSYQPREDIDIDTLFVDPVTGVGVPVINVEVSYKNIYGKVVSNFDLWNESAVKGFCTRTKEKASPMYSQSISSASSMKLDYPAIPETIYLAMNYGHLIRPSLPIFPPVGHLERKRALVNNPYRHFFYISGWDASHRPTVVFTFQEGDGTPGVYDKSYYNFPSGPATKDTPRDTYQGNDQWYILYDYLKDRGAENPFYDPYTSELGNLVSITFDQLVSGRVRVSIWDANSSTGVETPVAWLTAPEKDPEEPEQHWVYLEAGKRKTFYWDGVDNIGYWNILQSGEWADTIQGAFGDKPLVVGAGFYAWNDKTTNLHTLIGDLAPENFDKNGAPYYTIGQFGQFYVKIEVMNDDLVRKDMARTGAAEPRTVNSNALAKPGEWNSTAKTFIWTHLGEPTQVAIRIQDWVGAGPWTPNRITTEADWSSYSSPDADASLAEGKPVRITFVPRPRRGIMWERPDRTLDETKISVKLTRQVHLKATIFDQFWLLSGKSWQDFHSKYTVGTTEQKRVVNRMYHNDDHTLEWEDSRWRSGEALLAYEWIFDPSMFQKDWGRGQKEKLRYGDYEQLEVLPGFDPKRLGGSAIGERSYMLMAFINYLFYISAFTLDRSGRRQWCLNSWTDSNGNKRGFIDKSKIVTPQWRTATEASMPYAIVDYEWRGADRYLVRTIFVRQWKESYWTSASDARSPVSKYGITNPHQRMFVQAKVTDFNPRRGTFRDQSNAKQDRWLLAYTTNDASVNRFVRQKAGGANRTLALDGSLTYPSSTYVAPTAFGTWTFDRPGLTNFFSPSPCRDFHPYWRYPYMPDYAGARLDVYTMDMVVSNALDVLSCAASQAKYKLRDPAAKETWYGFAYADVRADTRYGGGTLEPSYTLHYYGARLEATVEETGAKNNVFEQDDIQYVYDYSREDSLDRFDQFRGVLSRAPYANRDIKPDASYRDGDKKRAASVQPVKPSGVYLVNLGRYNVYTLAPVHAKIHTLYSHFVDDVEDWFDIRFRHEYVWYSDRYFPVTPEGGAVYMYTKNEYTKVKEWAGEPWWTKLSNMRIYVGNLLYSLPVGAAERETDVDLTTLYYDAGAWIGWKDDAWINSVPSFVSPSQYVSWSVRPFLRWREVGTVTRNSIAARSTADAEHATGGFALNFDSTGMATAKEVWLHAPANTPQATFRRQNIFDEHYAKIRGPRLAVGPELPESRALIMNLVLPERLRG